MTRRKPPRSKTLAQRMRDMVRNALPNSSMRELGSLSDAKLDEIISMATSSGQLANRGSQASGPLGQAASIKPRSSRAVAFPDEYPKQKDLAQRFSDLQTMYPRSETRRLLDSSLFKIKQVFADGVIVAEFRDGDETYPLYVDTELSNQIPAACACENSDGRGPCRHSYSLLNILEGELKTPKSILWERIRSRQLDPIKDKPPASRFRFDTSVKTLGLLKKLATPVRTAGVAVDQLPPHEPPAVARRIIWNFCRKYSRNLEAAVQQRSKKGDRWLKPKPIEIGEFLSMTDLTNETDQKLRAIVKRDYGSYELPIVESLQLLQGDERFHIDGEPATIEFCEPSLRLQLTQDRWRFVFSWQSDSNTIDDELLADDDEDGDYGDDDDDDDEFYEDDGDDDDGSGGDVPRLVVSTSDASVYQLGKRLVRIVRFQPGEKNLFESLLSMDGVSRQHEAALFESCRQLANKLSIQLPDQANQTPLPTASYRPALLLRSNADGSLSYGWRLRGDNDQLIVPGEGGRVLGDQPPQQWQRSFAEEHRLVNAQADRLRLDRDSLLGTLADFSAAMDLITELQQAGDAIEVLWDSQSVAPVSYAGAITPSNLKVSIDRKRDWFQLNGMCQLGDRQFKLKDIIDAVSGDNAEIRGQYIRIGKGDWAKLSDDLKQNLQRLNRVVNVERGALNFDQTSALEMRELQRQIPIDTQKAWGECLQRLQQSEQLDPKLPDQLQADLREYQVDGFKWMRRLAEWGVGGVLADDMGLGKTVQTIAVLIDRAALGPSLVVAPTSVGFNWQRELQRFAPHLQSHLYRETDRSDFLTQLGPNDVVVSSYGLILRDCEKLKEIQWGSLVLDEAQAIKNARSKTSQAITELNATWTIALTGTPVENHLGELWSLFRAVSPGVLGSWEQFRKRFASPIERNQDEASKQALRDRMRPFVLRRTKREVLQDLPARTESSLTVELSPAERKLYDQTRLQVLSEAQTIALMPETNDQRFKILALITRLRQIACHPALVDPKWKGRSSKLQLLAETVADLKAEGHRVLVFSQFVQHLQLIRQMLEEESISYQYLDGTTPAAKRQEQVDQFQNGDATVFLISLKAGGTGLNLTAADYVIHMDPWWNPAVEDQATDRAHRMGQTKPVIVYRMICQQTIEEEILQLHDSKRDLIAGVLEGASQSAKLSTADLINLIRQS